MGLPVRRPRRCDRCNQPVDAGTPGFAVFLIALHAPPVVCWEDGKLHVSRGNVMSSSKPFCVLLCLLCLALPTLAEKPTDNRTIRTDSRSTDPSQEYKPRIKDIGGRTLEQWVKDLKHPDPTHRSRAVVAIVQFGEEASQYIPDLVKLLHDPDASPRIKTIVALRMMYIPKAHRSLVIKELGRCLVSLTSQSIHRYEAVKTLMNFGPLVDDEREVIMDLVQNLASPSTYELRSLCIDALLTAGPDPKNGPDARVTDALILRATPSREPAEEVRYKAVMALGALGRPQKLENLTKVINILKTPANYRSPNKVIRIWSHVGLMALDDKLISDKELKAIAENLKDPDSVIKANAAIALGALRDKAHAYVGDICAMAKREKDPMVRMAVAQSLARMGNKGQNVIKTLVSIVEDADRKNVSAALAACSALKELGVNDAQVTQSLETLAKQPSLEDYQKEMIKQIIVAIKNPLKKPLKDAAKVPKEGVAQPKGPAKRP
jgi:HEAT repeat protein